MNTSVSRLTRVVDMLDEAYAGPCSIARDPRPSRKVVSTLQVSRFMARQVHDGIPGNAAVGSTPERATPGVYRSGGLRSSRAGRRQCLRLNPEVDEPHVGLSGPWESREEPPVLP
jgi:hypothetical protein